MDPQVLEALRRNSRITLSAEGVFLFEGRPVANPRVQALFHRGLALRADGEVTLTVGSMWAYVECEGVARFIDGLALEPSGATVRLRDGTEHSLMDALIGYGPDDRFYAWLADSGSVALFARAAHQQLSGLVVDGPALDIGGKRLPLDLLRAVPAVDAKPPRQPGGGRR